jgi:hypothetical protein
MPQKYVDLMQQIPAWIPFLGLATGKSPLSTRFGEAIILAFVPVIVMAIWMIPKMEAKLESVINHQGLIMQTYSDNMKGLTVEVRENNQKLNTVITEVAILKNDSLKIEKKVDSIDDIANTKVRSIEGRLDSIEREVNRK